MDFNILNTQTIYQRLLSEPDAQTRKTIFREELAAPYEPLIKIFGAPDGDLLSMFAMWGMSVDHFDNPEKRQRIKAALDKLVAFGAWDKTVQTLRDVEAAFAPYMDRLSLGPIHFGLFWGDLSNGPANRGYTGFGGAPGYVMVVYDMPNDYNLYRLQGTTAHEMLHNIHFTVFPFSPFTTTVGEYAIAEGLAESFAAELYGEDVVGYYVTDFDDTQLETAKRLIGAALDVTGFNEIRSYIFGDAGADYMGIPKTGVPPYAGYAIGYRVVQQYLKRTGKKVTDAIFVPAKEIIAESGFFE
jgi:uncharacterized protein YjaZ